MVGLVLAAVVIGWVAFSLLSGIRSEATFSTTVSVLVSAVVFGLVALGYKLLVKVGWVTDDEKANSERERLRSMAERLREIAANPNTSPDERQDALSRLRQLEARKPGRL